MEAHYATLEKADRALFALRAHAKRSRFCAEHACRRAKLEARATMLHAQERIWRAEMDRCAMLEQGLATKMVAKSVELEELRARVEQTRLDAARSADATRAKWSEAVSQLERLEGDYAARMKMVSEEMAKGM